MKQSKLLTKSFQKSRNEQIKEIPSDYSQQQRKKIVDLISLDTNLFWTWTHLQIQQFVQLSKFYSFSKSTILARKDQIVDYFGIILSGTAIALYDDIVQAELTPYQMIGHMALMNLKGTLNHFFDIVAESDGIMMSVRLSQMRVLQTKYPQLYVKLSDLAACKSLESIKYQYNGQMFEMSHCQKTLGITFTDKRINQLFQICGNPELKQFWQNLQIRQKMMFSKCVKFYQMNQKDIVINKQIMHSCLAIILKGECISYSGQIMKDDSGEIISQGTVCGIENFFYQKAFCQNIYCRQKGVYLVLTKKNLQKMIKQKPSLVTNLYSFLVTQESKYTKRNFHKLSKGTVDDFFIQINLKKKRRKIVKQQKNDNKNLFGNFIKTYDIIPLHQNQFYRQLIKGLRNQKQMQAQSQKLKMLNKLQTQNVIAKTKNNQALKNITSLNQKTNINQNISSSNVMTAGEKKQKYLQYQKNLLIWQTFYSEKKAEFQKKATKSNTNSNTLAQSTVSINLQKNITQQQQQQTTKRINHLENQNNELRGQIQSFKVQINNLKQFLKNNNEKVIQTQTRIKKMQMHKELLKKSNLQANTISITSKKTSALSLKDVFSQQLKQNSLHRLVAKCAYKWLYQTRKRLKNKNKNGIL